jgi:hypothetical protein
MNTPHATALYKRHRFPAEIISHCVWLYYRFSRSYRDVEELMAERGVPLSHEAVRYWCRKFHIPPDFVVARGVSVGEGSSGLDLLCIRAPYSYELPQKKLRNINGLRFYHEIRWNLGS